MASIIYPPPPIICSLPPCSQRACMRPVPSLHCSDAGKSNDDSDTDIWTPAESKKKNAKASTGKDNKVGLSCPSRRKDVLLYVCVCSFPSLLGVIGYAIYIYAFPSLPTRTIL